ncbi:MAG: hypothetical protein JKY54_04315, partial [Flavobacteriales bacterium]|nr:hypothetical protein [Flavobacteriales bacterium]
MNTLIDTLPETQFSFNVAECAQYIWDSTVYSISGTYTKNYTSSMGCDSIVVLNLSINDISSPVVDIALLANITDECSVSMPVAPTATDSCAGSITGTTSTIFPITSIGTTVVV